MINTISGLSRKMAMVFEHKRLGRRINLQILVPKLQLGNDKK